MSIGQHYSSQINTRGAKAWYCAWISSVTYDRRSPLGGAVIQGWRRPECLYSSQIRMRRAVQKLITRRPLASPLICVHAYIHHKVAVDYFSKASRCPVVSFVPPHWQVGTYAAETTLAFYVWSGTHTFHCLRKRNLQIAQAGMWSSDLLRRAWIRGLRNKIRG